jgi:hypothetical protein
MSSNSHSRGSQCSCNAEGLLVVEDRRIFFAKLAGMKYWKRGFFPDCGYTLKYIYRFAEVENLALS